MDEIQEYIKQSRIEEPEFFPDEADAPILFSRLQTQWQRGGTGSITGLNYASLEPVARILNIKLDASLLTRLQLMESHVLKELAARDRTSRAQRQIHRR